LRKQLTRKSCQFDRKKPGRSSAGRVSKQAVEDHAKAEFDKYEVLRREYKESIGEVETIRQLENAAKKLTGGKVKRSSA
jgi:hypothetical protein